MAAELKRNVINMKSLDQDIKDPVIVGGGDAEGLTLAIIFTQEAAAQITPATKVYLKWRHQQTDIIGYNVFTQELEEPPTWSIHYPKSMLSEGDVTACIELVDDVSIATSVTFNIHVLSDPYITEKFTNSDDFTVFQNAVIDMNSATDKANEQIQNQACEFANLKIDIKDILREAIRATRDANNAADIASAVAEYYIQSIVEIIEF